uniref:Uncharacterized protein n=1 Tax=Arundo donax TaxID=35708 RepID=A0A0A9B952_ARUDO
MLCALKQPVNQHDPNAKYSPYKMYEPSPKYKSYLVAL